MQQTCLRFELGPPISPSTVISYNYSYFLEPVLVLFSNQPSALIIYFADTTMAILTLEVLNMTFISDFDNRSSQASLDIQHKLCSNVSIFTNWKNSE